MAKTEITNMVMLHDPATDEVVVIDRLRSWCGIAFPGGHVEPGEAFTDSVVREVKEETGLDIETPRLCGVKQFQTDEGERYVVFLYKADHFSGELLSSDEGRVFWIKREDLESYPLAMDFADLVKVFEDDSISEFFCFEIDGKYAKRLL